MYVIRVVRYPHGLYVEMSSANQWAEGGRLGEGAAGPLGRLNEPRGVEAKGYGEEGRVHATAGNKNELCRGVRYSGDDSSSYI